MGINNRVNIKSTLWNVFQTLVLGIIDELRERGRIGFLFSFSAKFYINKLEKFLKTCVKLERVPVSLPQCNGVRVRDPNLRSIEVFSIRLIFFSNRVDVFDLFGNARPVKSAE